MVNRNGHAQYVASEVLKAIFQTEEDSNFEDSDVSSEEEDYISECSDYSETESLEQFPSDEDECSNRSTCDDEDQSSRVRGQGGHDSHIQERGQGVMVQVDASGNDQTQHICW